MEYSEKTEYIKRVKVDKWGGMGKQKNEGEEKEREKDCLEWTNKNIGESEGCLFVLDTIND